MKYTVHFIEVLQHCFEYDAESPEAAQEMFERDADNGMLDFSDGDVVSSVADVAEAGEWVSVRDLLRDDFGFRHGKFYF